MSVNKHVAVVCRRVADLNLTEQWNAGRNHHQGGVSQASWRDHFSPGMITQDLYTSVRAVCVEKHPLRWHLAPIFTQESVRSSRLALFELFLSVFCRVFGLDSSNMSVRNFIASCRWIHHIVVLLRPDRIFLLSASVSPLCAGQLVLWLMFYSLNCAAATAVLSMCASWHCHV